MRALRTGIVASLLAVSIAGGVRAEGSIDNLLQDSSFEDGIPGAFSSHWVPFGKAFPEEITARTGTHVVKLFGNFDAKDNFSGVFQDVAVEGSEKYEASIYIRTNEEDKLTAGTKAWVKLEFYDGEGNMVGASESPEKLTTFATADNYKRLTTGAVMAPVEAAKARFVYIFQQEDPEAGGATLGDDPQLRKVD